MLLAVSQHCHHCINNNLIILAIAAIAMATAIIAIYFWSKKRVIKIENVLYIHVTEYIICVQWILYSPLFHQCPQIFLTFQQILQKRIMVSGNNVKECCPDFLAIFLGAQRSLILACGLLHHCRENLTNARKSLELHCTCPTDQFSFNIK